ncbi:MAG: hypothetical protein HY748_16890 [Elusimicrobia bacterium]|nr:hypothetical protein [Elusimicrobiota bacterium]
MRIHQLLGAAALAAWPWAWASAQTIEVPRQSGQSSINVGPGGQGTGGSVNTDVNRPAADPIQLKGSIDGYQAPVIQQDSALGPAGPAGATLDLGAADLGAVVPTVAPEAFPHGRAATMPKSSPAVPRSEVKPVVSAPLQEVVPVTEGLSETVTEIQKSRKEGGLSGEVAIESALNKIFEGARAAAKKTMDSAEFGSVLGAMLRVENKIRRTVSVANTSSPHDAPKLYESAVETAKESLPPSTAEEVRKTVLASADRKAETALPDLANDALRLAAAGSSKGVARDLRSFYRWEELLGSPGRPLIENLSHLKSFLQNILTGAVEAGGRASPAALGKGVAAGGAVEAPAVLKKGVAAGGSGGGQAQEVSAQTSPSASRIWFRRNAATRSFQAVLPGSAVSPVPELALSFGLSQVSSSFAVEDEAFAAFLAEPTAGNGFRLVYRALRGAGTGRARSLLAAATYWVKSVLAQAASWLKSLLRRPLSAEEVAAIAVEEAVAYEAAQGLLSKGMGSLSVAAARELIGRAGRMAALYERLTADGGGIGAVEDVRLRFEESARRAGSAELEPLTPAAARWITGGDGHSLVYWIERIHLAVAALSPASRAGGVGSAARWDGLLPEALDGDGASARGPLERLLGDVLSRRDSAAKTAALLAALDPSPSRYTDLGRVGGLLAQGLSLRLKDGRPLVLVVLRDADMGHLAFARAEFKGSSRSLSVKELAAVLRVE